MGMAASQARYLALTARKSNVEFQGQQINQQRTLLAVEEGELFSKLMLLENPVPPNPYDYEYDVYTFEAADTKGDVGVYTVDINSIKPTETEGVSTMTVSWVEKGVTYEDTIEGEFTGLDPKVYSNLNIISGGTNAQIETGPVGSLKKGKESDDKAYQEAMNQYNADMAVYNAEIEKINQKTEQIQLKDRTLELKLRNLDTEQNALQTELESVKSVIKETVERVFKTFQS